MDHQQQIRQAFNAAANTYDASAGWQKEVADILMNHVQQYSPDQKTILDLGAGTGTLSQAIEDKYPNNQLIALDLAESMLILSQSNLRQASLLCADAGQLPLSNHSVDLIVSNLMLHWCPSLISALKEQHRILKPNGKLIFSITGQRSLAALKAAWHQVDHHSHINTFPDEKQLRSSCQHSQLSLLHFKRHQIENHYNNVYELMRELKNTGVINISHTKPPGLTGKQKMAALNQYYQNPTRYEIFIVVCQK